MCFSWFGANGFLGLVLGFFSAAVIVMVDFLVELLGFFCLDFLAVLLYF